METKTISLRDIHDRCGCFEIEELGEFLTALMNIFSTSTQDKIISFLVSNYRDDGNNYQNNLCLLLRDCIKQEISPRYCIIRRLLKVSVLTMETTISIPLQEIHE